MNPYNYYIPLQVNSYYNKTKRSVRKSIRSSVNSLLKITGLNMLVARKKEEVLPDFGKKSKVLMYGADLF